MRLSTRPMKRWNMKSPTSASEYITPMEYRNRSRCPMTPRDDLLTRQQAADNRERKRAPKRGRSWCPACDRAQVSDGQRCPRCGRRKLPRRAKR